MKIFILVCSSIDIERTDGAKPSIGPYTDYMVYLFYLLI